MGSMVFLTLATAAVLKTPPPHGAGWGVGKGPPIPHHAGSTPIMK